MYLDPQNWLTGRIGCTGTITAPTHLMTAGYGRRVDKDGFGRVLRDGGEGGHGGGGGTPRVVGGARLGRALDGLDQPFHGGLVVLLATVKIFLAQAGYTLGGLQFR